VTRVIFVPTQHTILDDFSKNVQFDIGLSDKGMLDSIEIGRKIKNSIYDLGSVAFSSDHLKGIQTLTNVLEGAGAEKDILQRFYSELNDRNMGLRKSEIIQTNSEVSFSKLLKTFYGRDPIDSVRKSKTV
jgi:bisphosphoglycerate-dependent phosphoglycerate mutase